MSYNVVSNRLLSQKAKYLDKLKTIWKGEYILVGEYLGKDKETTFKHTKCNNQFDAMPSNILKQKLPCKWCNYNSHKNTPIYKYQLEKRFPGEYTVLSEYLGTNTVIKVRHNPCQSIGDYNASALLNGQEKCELCSRSTNKRNTSSFRKMLVEKIGSRYDIVGEYVNSRTSVTIRHYCAPNTMHEYSANPNELLRGKSLCPVCTKRSKLIDTTAFKKG